MQYCDYDEENGLCSALEYPDSGLRVYRITRGVSLHFSQDPIIVDSFLLSRDVCLYVYEVKACLPLREQESTFMVSF